MPLSRFAPPAVRRRARWPPPLGPGKNAASRRRTRRARALLAGAFGNSAFLLRLALRESEALADYFLRARRRLLAAASALALTTAVR